MATGCTVPAANLQHDCQHHQLKGSTTQQALLPLSVQEHVCPSDRSSPITPEGCPAAAAASDLTPDVSPSPKRARTSGNSMATQLAGDTCLTQHQQQHLLQPEQQQEQVLQLQHIDDEAAWLAAAAAAAAASVAASETRSASDPGSASLLSSAALPEAAASLPAATAAAAAGWGSASDPGSASLLSTAALPEAAAAAAAAAAGVAQVLPDLPATMAAQYAGQADAAAAASPAAAAAAADGAPQLPAVQALHPAADEAAAAAELPGDIHGPLDGGYIVSVYIPSSSTIRGPPQSPPPAAAGGGGLSVQCWDAAMDDDALLSPAAAAAAADAAAAVRAAEAAEGFEMDLDDAGGSSSMEEDEEYESSSEDGSQPQSPAAAALPAAAAAAAAAPGAWDVPMQDADGSGSSGSLSDEGEEWEEGEEGGSEQEQGEGEEGDSEHEGGEGEESEYESDEEGEGEGEGAPSSSAGISLPQPLPAAAVPAEPWQPPAAQGLVDEGGASSDSGSEGSEGEEEDSEDVNEGEEDSEGVLSEGEDEGLGVSQPAPDSTAAAAAVQFEQHVQYAQRAEDGGEEAAAMFEAAHTAALAVLSREGGDEEQQGGDAILQQQRQQQGEDAAGSDSSLLSDCELLLEAPELPPGTVLSLELLRSVQPSGDAAAAAAAAADSSESLIIGTATATVQQLLSRGSEGSTDMYLCRVTVAAAAAGGDGGCEVPQPDSEYLVLKVWNAAGAAALGIAQEELQAGAWDFSSREAWVLSYMQKRHQRESHFLSCFGYARVAAVQPHAASSSAGVQGLVVVSPPPGRGADSSSSGSEFVGLPCLLLYWCEGGSLEQRLEPSAGLHVPLSARETWRVMRDVHTALCQAHEATIMLGRLSTRGVLVRQGCGYAGGDGYCLCSVASAWRQRGGRAKQNSGAYDMGAAWGAPDELYGQHSESWKLGLLFLACRTGLASSPPNGRCFDEVATAVVKRVPHTLMFTKAELELMHACFADESARQAPCDLRACSYFKEECFKELSAQSPLSWTGKDDTTC